MDIGRTSDFESTITSTYPALAGGNAENFDLTLERITLKSGTAIEFERAGVTAIVGANNAGKSTVLREIQEILQTPYYGDVASLSVANLDVRRHGSSADLASWLSQRAPFSVGSDRTGFHHPRAGLTSPDTIATHWNSDGAKLGQLAHFFCFYGNAEARLVGASSAEMRESISDPPSQPVHFLQDDKRLFEEVSSINEAVFGQPLTLDTLAKTIRLRVGRLNQTAPRVDNIPTAYVQALSTLRPLDQQGDGIRSFLGQLLPILTGSHRIVLIDEPEAFLHPPQAHALGKELGRVASEKRTQVIVATHDRNLLSGLLASGAKTTVARLSRPTSGDATANQLRADALDELWTDPVLKYTNVLDGLFHRAVVTAEAEGDCAYLAAALDSSDSTGKIPSNEILFVPTGGKDGMAKVARALQAVDVPVVAAPDLDRLSNKSKVRELVEAVGSVWTTEMSSLWDQATVHLRARTEPARVGHVLRAINAALVDHEDEAYSDEYRETIRAHIRSSGSPWDAVKEYGVSAFKKEARLAVEELLAQLDAAHVVLVREGELEQLAPEVAARKGPGWLNAALTIGSQRNSVTQSHVRRIVDAVARAQ